MDHFTYRSGELCAETVLVSKIAAYVGTPFYLYSSATLLRHFKLLDDALEGMEHLVCYAMKAASNQAILKLLSDVGAGMDVVSEANISGRGLLAYPVNALSFQVLAKHVQKWKWH